MSMGESAIVAGIALDFADLNHLGDDSGVEEEGSLVLMMDAPVRYVRAL